MFDYFSAKPFSDVLSEALKSDMLVCPGLKGLTASCIASSFKNNVNLLFFSGDVDFIVCQRLIMCDSIVIPDHGLCVPNPQSSALNSYMGVIDDMPAFEPGGFNGVINGYHRPYHFFYDKLFPLLSDLSEVEGYIPYVNIAGSFLDLSLIDKRFILESKKINDPGFFLVPAKSRYTRTPASFFRGLSLSLSRGGDSEELEKYDFIVWIGMALEKRRWIERSPALLVFIELVKNFYSKPLFVIDGLTSDSISDPKKIREGKSSKEVAEWESIKNLVGEVEVLDLIGAKAHQKILIANKVDFYISSHLTDSIWCATLGFKPGLTYQANASRGRGSFIHPLTNCFPAAEVVDSATSSTVDYDGLDININPLRFSLVAFYSAMYTKSLNEALRGFLAAIKISEDKWFNFSTASLDIPKNSNSLLVKRFANIVGKSVGEVFCKFYLGDNSVVVENIDPYNDCEIPIPQGACLLVFEGAGDAKNLSLSKTSVMLKI